MSIKKLFWKKNFQKCYCGDIHWDQGKIFVIEDFLLLTILSILLIQKANNDRKLNFYKMSLYVNVTVSVLELFSTFFKSKNI